MKHCKNDCVADCDFCLHGTDVLDGDGRFEGYVKCARDGKNRLAGHGMCDEFVCFNLAEDGGASRRQPVAPDPCRGGIEIGFATF